MILQMINYLKTILEYAGGVTDDMPPEAPRWMASPIWWGIWWAFLALVILAFCGQTSKFIYIDF
jgi:hypothetical protein